MAVDLQDLNIDIAVSLSAPPISRAGFGTVLLMSPEASPVSGDLTMSFSTTAEIAAGVTAGDMTQRLATALGLALSQSPRPAVVKIAKIGVTTAADPTIAADIAAILAEDTDWYGAYADLLTSIGPPVVAPDAEATLTLTAAGIAIEALDSDHVMLQGSADPIMYTAPTTDPAGVEAAAAHERSPVIYEQWVGAAGDETQFGAYAALARWLSFDPDVISAVFAAQVTGILPAATSAAAPVDLTTAQLNFILGKEGNHFSAYGSAPAFINEGTNPVGRQLHEILTADWLSARIREDLASAAVARANLGQKWPLNNTGVALVANIVNSRLAAGITAGHFQEVTNAAGTFDVDAKSITVAARAQVLNSNVRFNVNIAFTSGSVNA